MNTIMTIAHNANNIAVAGQVEKETTVQGPKVRLIYDIDNKELHLLEGNQQQLEVVHPVHEPVHHFAEEIIAARKKVEDACRIYEDRINKRPPSAMA